MRPSPDAAPDAPGPEASPHADAAPPNEDSGPDAAPPDTGAEDVGLDPRALYDACDGNEEHFVRRAG